ncbi:hypothetical protein J6590_027637 [Homalodisca vitripennis]|nr:hypothetical protein J6590_027637 [Homalodisca vitripennis]
MISHSATRLLPVALINMYARTATLYLFTFVRRDVLISLYYYLFMHGHTMAGRKFTPRSPLPPSLFLCAAPALARSSYFGDIKYVSRFRKLWLHFARQLLVIMSFRPHLSHPLMTHKVGCLATQLFGYYIPPATRISSVDDSQRGRLYGNAAVGYHVPSCPHVFLPSITYNKLGCLAT